MIKVRPITAKARGFFNHHSVKVMREGEIGLKPAILCECTDHGCSARKWLTEYDIEWEIQPASLPPLRIKE